MEVRVARDERDAEFERERKRGESAKGGTSGGARKMERTRKGGGRGKERKIEERNSGRMKGGRSE